MPRMLYRGIDADGNPVQDFIEAENARAALALLRERGLSEVELLDDAFSAALREWAPQVDPHEVARIEAAMRKGDAGLWQVWGQVARGARWWLMGTLALAALGLWRGSGALTIIGLGLAGLPFAMSALAYRSIVRYQAFLRACAWGRREEAQRLGAQLASRVKELGMRFDIQVRLAEFLAAEGRLNEALAMVEPFRKALEARGTGLFEARVAILPYKADDAALTLELLNKALACSDGDVGRMLDVALLEARIGDPARARRMFDGIVHEELPADWGRMFHTWCEGLLLEREGADGRARLADAVRQFTAHVRLPAFWASLAVATCDYALALARHGEAARGLELIQTVWPLARLHLNRRERQAIEHFSSNGTLPTSES